eukprot:CAMPEP_0197072826 /NCGR_PEP_ID=MMETSP1384-20130603/210292_1 /TAXON_ID=29189 /ORGANISM="Ammonia sp." /LENGTH=907 /DNA_ID=CAMNT_0042511647 /DNA_START=100 /DNA_END=2824 /DNA_ORIENTATION=-
MSTQAAKYHPPSLQTPEISIYFICRIESSYPHERIEFVTSFCKRFRHRIDQHAQYLDHEQEPLTPSSLTHTHSDDANDSKPKRRFYTDEDVFNVVEHSPFHEILVLFGPYIVHNRFMCPIKQVSQAFADLIEHINQKLNVSIPCRSPPYPLSGFLELSWVQYPFELEANDSDSTTENGTNSTTMSSDYEEEEIEENLSSHHKQFSVFGRITHLCLLLQSHKSYLSDFLSLFHALMYDENGPLGHDERQFLGLMAASRFGCKAVLEQCQLQYRKFNGDMTWIKAGITSAPHKYQKMAKLNAMLAHQPWLIGKQHIAELVNGDGAWSISECVQAFVILVTYQGLCGLYQGLCITPEIDNYFASTLQSTMQSLSLQDEQHKNVIDDILSPMISLPQPSQVVHALHDVEDDEQVVRDLRGMQLNGNHTNEEDEDQRSETIYPVSYDLTAEPSQVVHALHDVEDDEQVVRDLHGMQLNGNHPNEEDEDQRSETIAKLLSHTQEHLVEDEDPKKAFEEAACLHLELGSLQETNLYDNPEAARSCFIKFRQLSDLTDDDTNDELNGNIDDSLSMEFDPNMAPPSQSATSKEKMHGDSASLAMQPIDEESKQETQQQDNADTIHKVMDTLDHVSSIPTKQPNELTANDWKQLISLREQNMFAMKSVNSMDEKDIIINNNNNNGKTEENTLWQTNDQKLAKLTNPSKNKQKGGAPHNGKLSGKKIRQIQKQERHKYRKINAPKSQGSVYWKYTLGFEMVYEDFDFHKNEQMHAYDFNWDKHGYACLSRYYPGIEKKMDAVFRTAYTMTDHSINNAANVDTEPFRIAIWHYVFRLFGVNNDSYEYRFVNVYLPVKLKIFIKKLVCYSQIVTVADLKKMGVALKEHEKIHVAILALEAKKQASLLFALKAIMKFMQSN